LLGLNKMDYTLKYTTNLSSLITEARDKSKIEYPNYSREQQINALARTMFAEGRGEQEAGMRRVLDSILARSGNDTNNIVGIVSEPFQYSCWNGMKPCDWSPSQFKVRDASGADKDKTQWDTAVSLATKAVNGEYTPTHTEPFYHTTDVHPKWSRGKTGTVDGNHIFYTNKEINGTDSYNAVARYNTSQVNDKTLLSPKSILAQRAANRNAKTGTKTTPKPQTAVKQTTSVPKKSTAVQPSNVSNSQYVVQKGDTLSAIAKRNGYTVDDIMKVNKGLNPDVIKVGQSIGMPNSQYTVKKGDTISSIAKNLGSTVSNITQLNKGINPDVIKIGQVLNVPK
jgi:LysM repeat protein